MFLILSKKIVKMTLLIFFITGFNAQTLFPKQLTEVEKIMYKDNQWDFVKFKLLEKCKKDSGLDTLLFLSTFGLITPPIWLLINSMLYENYEKSNKEFTLLISLILGILSSYHLVKKIQIPSVSPRNLLVQFIKEYLSCEENFDYLPKETVLLFKRLRDIYSKNLNAGFFDSTDWDDLNCSEVVKHLENLCQLSYKNVG